MAKRIVYSVPDTRFDNLSPAQQTEALEAFAGWPEVTLRKYWLAKREGGGWEACMRPVHTGAPRGR